MRFFLLHFCFLLFTLMALTGCGKKGALYLPESAPATSATSATPTAGAEPVNPPTQK
jgi:predicted small lipoprotein YifL